MGWPSTVQCSLLTTTCGRASIHTRMLSIEYLVFAEYSVAFIMSVLSIDYYPMHIVNMHIHDMYIT